jgi:hypothetical protein
MWEEVLKAQVEVVKRHVPKTRGFPLYKTNFSSKIKTQIG